MRFRKCMSVALAATLTASLCLCGCGDKKVDYSLDDDTGDTGTTGQGVLATNLGIPESYEGEVNVGNSGLKSITINDSDIITPDGDSMDYVTCVEKEFDSDYKKQICEALFDTGEGIYVYDEDHQLIEDVQIQTDYYQGLLDSVLLLDSSDYTESYQYKLNVLDTLSDNAVTELSAAGDYSADDYLGYIDGQKYILSFVEESDEYGNTWPVFYLRYYPEENLINERPYEDAEKVTTYSTSDTTILDTDVNPCSMDEAESDARDILGRLGIEDISIIWSGDLVWEYTNANNELLSRESDGYTFDFTRSVAGEEALPVYASIYKEEISENSSSSGTYQYLSCNECYSISITSDGLFSLSISYVLTEENKEQNVDLISWDEVLQILNDEAGTYFTENEPDYSNIEFDDVRLTYMLIRDPDNDGTYNYTPVWYFAQASENSTLDGYEELYAGAYMIINAMDGSIYSFDDIFQD